MRNLIIILFCLVSLGVGAQTTEMETRYNALAERFDGRDKQLQRDLKTYLRRYPYTTYADEVKFMQGVIQVEKGHYKQGTKILEQVTAQALTRAHQNDYTFYRGYAYLMLQDYQRASIYFRLLAKDKHLNRHTNRGRYYYAYCMYKMEKYDEALPALLPLEISTEYAKTVPYFITQIYYAQKNYDEVEQRAERLLREYPESLNNTELHRILGEMYFLQDDYSRAAEQLDLYQTAVSEQKEEPVRSDLYMAGTAHYRLGEYEQAVNALKNVKPMNDSLSEAACLTMGNAYVQLGQPEKAKLSYQAAAAYKITPAISEEAAYNYALCSYQSSSALGEAVRAFNDFLRLYPDSKYEGHIFRLLSDALMQSKDYPAAIAILDSISNPSTQMLETKQYLRYQQSADLFLQGKMQRSSQWATEVMTHTGESDAYTTEALYLRAEANYRMRKYEACESDLKKYLARPDAKKSPNYGLAHYLQGYAYFAQGQYDKARNAFSVYLDAAESESATYADALNRIGDCYFNARNFKQAITYYTQVSSLGSSGADYALFQRGYALGLQHKYNEKINVLRELVKRYPKSDYADDGVYEIARAQLQQNDEKGAIVTYEQLLASYPHSSLARKACLERAMLFRNLGQNDEAIAAYRKTIEKYPATEEAYTALDALQALYVELDQVSEYLAYTKKLAKMNMNVTTREDSLLYAAAEMQYIQAAYNKAAASFSDYINRFCAGGRYCTSARYFLADSYYRLGKKDEALAQYAVLAETSANPYQEEAATRVAEICYDKEDYACALEGFTNMYALASSRENTVIARLGIMRCCRALERHQESIDIATQILNDSPVSEETRSEARYSRAKAYMALGKWREAQPDLKALSSEVRTAQGAESQFLLALSWYELHQADEAEEQIMRFTKMNTTQQYWLARALILLSDINRDREEFFQARQYLQVLEQNYTRTDDDIHALIAARMAQLDRTEPQQTEEKEEEDEEE